MLKLAPQSLPKSLGFLQRAISSSPTAIERLKLIDRASNRYARAEMKTWNAGLKRGGAVGFKLGMMSHYDEWGRRHPVTVLRLDGCQVTRSFPQGKSIIQEVGAGLKSKNTIHPAQLKLFNGLEITPKLAVRGFSVSQDALLPPGTPIFAAHFIPGQFIDVRSKSIGKGFQGAMKRWGFKGMPASHGVSGVHRHMGSTGCRTDPGRVLKGKKMPGRMGGHYVTCKSLKVLKIDNALNCIFVRGAVAGKENGIVEIWDSKKNPIFKANPPPFPTFIPGPDRILPRIMLAPGETKDTLHMESPK